MLRLFTSALGPIAPAAAAGHARRLLDRAHAENVAVLHAYVVPGDVLGLGRFHRTPGGSDGAVRLLRRLGGGRPVPLGEGFVGLHLALPHRSALVGDDPERLSPEQVLNRSVRGLLGALRRFGVEASYPGLDVVSVDGRIVAGMTFEVRDDGATLVETALAVGRSYAEVVRFADIADPKGAVPIEMVLPDRATCLADCGAGTPSLDALVDALAAGYAERLGIDAVVTPAGLPPGAEADDGVGPASEPTPPLDRRARTRGLLGVVEADARIEGARLADVRVYGDLIAPSATVARIEEALRGAPIEREDLRTRVRATLAAPGAFLLGTTGDVVADLVFEAAAS
jgi:lipoate-protein ligase A